MKNIILFLIVLLTLSCTSNEFKSTFHIATPIRDIYNKPTTIGSDSIYITGIVTQAYPAKGLSGYIIENEGYKIWVWTKANTAPSVGATKKIKGVVKIIGDSYFFFDKSFR